MKHDLKDKGKKLTAKEKMEGLKSLFSKSQDLLFKEHRFEQGKVTLVFF
ncbi:hypothetical protein [Bacillus sp. Marseille-Q1617]|nr:hypothetical protein [Bacillus sp. Marseille-Q1617]